VRTLSGHFDGEHIVLDEPAELRPNTKVSIIVPEHEEAATEIAKSGARLSEPAFRRIWDNPLDADYDKL
jgi:hypothetical protein